MDDNLRRLATVEPGGHLSVLLLTLVTAARGLSLAGGGTTTASDSLVVGAQGVGERGEDVGVASLCLELGEKEGERRGRGGGGRLG